MLRISRYGVLVLILTAAASWPMGTDDEEVAGKVKEVNAKTKSFVLTMADKTDRTFQVNKETKFTGPRGSDREEGLGDPCMAQGYEIKVVPAVDPKVAKEVKLPTWKGDPKAKKKG